MSDSSQSNARPQRRDALDGIGDRRGASGALHSPTPHGMARKSTSIGSLGGGALWRYSPLSIWTKLILTFFQFQYQRALITLVEHTFGICSQRKVVVQLRMFGIREVEQNISANRTANSTANSAQLMQTKCLSVNCALFCFLLGGETMERMTVQTGVRMTPSQAAKLERLAENMRMPKNRLMGLLIDSAEAQALPAVSVALAKNSAKKRKRDNAGVTLSSEIL